MGKTPKMNKEFFPLVFLLFMLNLNVLVFPTSYSYIYNLECIFLPFCKRTCKIKEHKYTTEKSIPIRKQFQFNAINFTKVSEIHSFAD